MSSLAFLVTELQSLASETRRKHPEIREAAEKSLAILRSSPEQATASLSSDGPQSDDLLRPVFMGCATKNAKVVAISLGSLQRLIALKAVPQSAVPVIISTMSDAMSQGVDIQLRILQTLVSLITNFASVSGDLLGDALLLCFKLQDSRIAVVSSTAAATLRQLVMFVVDKMVDEDQRDNIDPQYLIPTPLPDGSTKALGPYARDAFSVFEDLCLLANSEKPNFLELDYLHKTFALELIESVLTNYHDLFRKHPELLLLLQHHLSPLLLKSLSERPVFPLTLRSTRVIFLLLKQFSFELKTEAEVFLMLLIKMISDDADATEHPAARPPWTRVLALEIMRGVCSDAELVRNIWDRYDAEHPGSKVFTSLISALRRLITEKPALLGVGQQMFGVGVPAHAGELSVSGSSSLGYGLDVGGMAGMVATAASATVSGVVGMIGSGSGLSVQGSAMKLQCIDQLDKADSPPIPESYVYLLGVQCIVSLCEGFASFAVPLYSSIVIQKPRAPGDPPMRAPPALDLSALPPDDASTRHLLIVRSMVENGWPALLAALSFIIATNLSDSLFLDVLTSYQAMTHVAGMLALSTPRDAFLTSLAKFSIPARVVSSLDTYYEPPTPRSSGASITENLGLTGPSQPPGLSERNLACLKVLVGCALVLSGSLGESWYGVLEALQNADYVLTVKGSQPSGRRGSMPVGFPSNRSVSASASDEQTKGSSSRHPLLTDIDAENVHNAIHRLFDASKNLEDAAFQDFLVALCKLSSEMVSMQSDGSFFGKSESQEDVHSPMMLTPKSEIVHRRRVSGIHLPKTLRSGDFGVDRLGGVAMLNIHRLIYRSPDVAWNTTTSHLLSILGLPSAPQPIRVQAAKVLDEILVVVPRNLSSTGDLQAIVQRRVLDVLAQQIIPSDNVPSSTTNVDLRRMGLETLHQILQASGHTLVVGWETIFEMLGSVCKPPSPSRAVSVDSVSTLSLEPSRPRPLSMGLPSEKGYTALVKIAFQSLKLVCDSVSSLSPEHLRLCISTLGQFGRQADTNIALTAAESLLWSVSDSIQAKRKDVEKEPEYSSLWMSLLLEVLGLCTDARAEVRVGAIQTLFRAMQLYGATLSLETWDECVWKVTFPLLDAISIQTRGHALPSLQGATSVSAPDKAWDESKTLALHSIGSIINDFLTTKIMRLDSFTKAWTVFVRHIQDTVLLDSRTLSPPALHCLEKSIKASASADPTLKSKVAEAWECAWQACDQIGGAILQGGKAPPYNADTSNIFRPFTQESLVAFIEVIRSTRSVSRSLDGVEWPLDRLKRLMTILKDVLTYPYSPDYRPDIDGLTPVQAAVMNAIEDVDLSLPGSCSLVMRDLSEYATLTFLAAFDVQPTPSLNPTSPAKSTGPHKRITYISLSKKTMPVLVDLYIRFEQNSDIYVDGTLEAVLSSYAIPIKLKYDCPAPSKFGKDLPLWKTATTSFLRIVKECAQQMKGMDIPDERVEGIWRQVIEVFRGGILADCSAAETFPLEVQEAEENFDLALIAALEIDVVPHLGDLKVPDYLVIQLTKVLHQGSQLYSFGASLAGSTSTGGSQDFEKVDADNLGNTAWGNLVPRERFSYWCFDLLFLICSDISKDWEVQRKRVATLSLLSLLDRCHTTMISYVADESLRGHLPFPRAREDELLYVLRKLFELRLWPGTLWAALSDSPSAYTTSQPVIDVSLSPSALIADVVKRSSVAHLFHFYSILCEIASIPRKTPSAWVPSGPSISSPSIVGGNHAHISACGKEHEEVVEVDARSLARECLKIIGKEMGAAP